MTDGSKYEGRFKKGMKNGQGKYTLPDGQIHQEGIWRDDKFVQEDDFWCSCFGNIIKIFFLGFGLYCTYLIAVDRATAEPEKF